MSNPSSFPFDLACWFQQHADDDWNSQALTVIWHIISLFVRERERERESTGQLEEVRVQRYLKDVSVFEEEIIIKLKSGFCSISFCWYYFHLRNRVLSKTIAGLDVQSTMKRHNRPNRYQQPLLLLKDFPLRSLCCYSSDVGTHLACRTSKKPRHATDKLYLMAVSTSTPPNRHSRESVY